MSKKAGDTNQDEILDEAYLHHGGPLGWSIFGEGRLSPDEIVARMEEEEDPASVREWVLARVLDRVLGGWNREVDVRAVGVRALRLAAAFDHWAGAGEEGLEGVRREMRVGGVSLGAIVRRILDHWFLDRTSYTQPREKRAMGAGKKVLAIGKFLNHAELEGWSLSQIALACGETPAGVMERVRKTCNRPVEYQGGKGKATWQQGAEQRAGSAEAQRELGRKRRTAKGSPKTRKR